MHAVVAWAVFRAVGYAAGVRFDARSAPWFWQYLDLEQLREAPLSSLFHLHAQPPAFNALLAIGQWADEPAFFYELVFRGLGLALSLGLARAWVLLGASRPAAVVGLWTFAALPSSILYEAWLFYSLPVAVLVLWSVVAFGRALGRRSWRDVGVWIALVALRVLTRSVFHWTWLLGCAALFGWHARRRVGGAGPALVLLVVFGGALFVKNAIVFGHVGSSSWLGMSLAKHALEPLDDASRRALVEGEPPEVARLVDVLPFSEVHHYPTALREVPARFEHVPVLAEARKSNGQPNLNHAAYLAISARYAELSKKAIVAHPRSYARSVGRALLTLASPSVEYWELLPNLSKLSAYHDLLMRLGGVTAFEPESYRAFTSSYLATRVSPLYSAFALFAFGWGAVVAFRRREPRARRASLQLAVFTIAFSTAAQVVVEVGENHRIGYEVFPLGWVLAVAAVDRVARRLGMWFRWAVRRSRPA